MAAIESGVGHSGDRLVTTARWLLGLMALAAVNLVAVTVYYVVSMGREIDDPNEGPIDFELWEIALLASPIAVLLAAHVVLVVKGLRLLAGLRSGDERARMSTNTWAYASAFGALLFAGWMTWQLSASEVGEGINVLSPSAAVETMTSGQLNSIGWTGLASFSTVVVLLIGAMVIATVTRPPRDKRD